VIKAYLYSLIIEFAVWAVLLPLQLLKLLFGKSSLDETLQRMAWIRGDGRNHLQTIIIHAVSYGEMVAAEPIISRLIAENRNLRVILTTGNKDGMVAARSLHSRYPNIISPMFLPWDRARAIKHWLTILQPDLVVLVETEIWPNLISSCHNLQIPVCIVNGRIYPKDVARYRLIRGFMKNVLKDIDWIGVQDNYEYQRFLTIGALEENLEIVGNVKYDQSRRSGTDKILSLASIKKTQMPLLLAGSTHAPEEKIIIEAFKLLKLEYPDLQLMVAPRKISRVGEIEKVVIRQGFQVLRCSALKPDSALWDVLIIDELGWLSSLYAVADIVFVGGSLANHGGHNLLEAAAQGKAIVVGPYMQHFQSIVEEFDRKKALLWLKGESELKTALGRLLAVPAERLKMGKMALAVVLENRGCSQRYTQKLNELMARVQ